MSTFQVVTASNGRIVIVGEGNIHDSDVYVFDFDNEKSKEEYNKYFTQYIENFAHYSDLDDFKVTISVEPINGESK